MRHTNNSVLVSCAAWVCAQLGLHVASWGAGGVPGSEARGLATRSGAAQRAALLLGVHHHLATELGHVRAIRFSDLNEG